MPALVLAVWLYSCCLKTNTDLFFAKILTNSRASACVQEVTANKTLSSTYSLELHKALLNQCGQCYDSPSRVKNWRWKCSKLTAWLTAGLGRDVLGLGS